MGAKGLKIYFSNFLVNYDTWHWRFFVRGNIFSKFSDFEKYNFSKNPRFKKNTFFNVILLFGRQGLLDNFFKCSSWLRHLPPTFLREQNFSKNPRILEHRKISILPTQFYHFCVKRLKRFAWNFAVNYNTWDQKRSVFSKHFWFLKHTILWCNFFIFTQNTWNDFFKRLSWLRHITPKVLAFRKK